MNMWKVIRKITISGNLFCFRDFVFCAAIIVDNTLLARHDIINETMTNWSFGKKEIASLKCKNCNSTPHTKPERWAFLTNEELSKCPAHVQNKAKQLDLEKQVYKGKYCRVCGPKCAAKKRDVRSGFEERFDAGEETCPQCGKDSPGIHDLPKPPPIKGKRPFCLRCRVYHRTRRKGYRGKKRKAEETYIDETTQQMCYGECNRAVPKADFVRFYLRNGKLTMDDDITRFRQCAGCGLKASKTRKKRYKKIKYKQAQEKMGRAIEDMEMYQTNGCYTHGCPCNIKDWFAHCEGRTTGGVGKPEELPLRKKAMAYDWDHRGGKKGKKGTVSQMENQEERTAEIEGDPAHPKTTGCALPCIPCHREKTWLNFEMGPQRGKGKGERRKTLRSMETLIIAMKREKWGTYARLHQVRNKISSITQIDANTNTFECRISRTVLWSTRMPNELESEECLREDESQDSE